ncbi:MAG: hypothetical protein K9J25_03630 [Bacteroidales bacterium]|nr:hypothetical protein [Bacteroidales bacterium]
MKKKVFLGNNEYRMPVDPVSGRVISIDDEEFYLVENYDRMDPFLMSVVSSSDHWMYISSTGGLTAGRRNPDNALFPYYTDDKIHESGSTTGSRTLIISQAEGKRVLWEPFSGCPGVYEIKRRIYKNITGNKLLFEEENIDLGMVYRYAWMNSDKYGLVKRSGLQNVSGNKKIITIIDGLRNILPYGVSTMMQTGMSTLVDAYKKSELDEESGMAVFRLSSIPVDKAVPSEALKCSSLWTAGYDHDYIVLTERQFDSIIKGEKPLTETGARGVKGCYYTVANMEMKPGSLKTKYYVAELEQDSSDIEELSLLLENRAKLRAELEKDIEKGSEILNELVKNADGVQSTADEMTRLRHFSNVMFNLMRGGTFRNDYLVNKDSYTRHLRRFNRIVYEKSKEWIDNLPDNISLKELHDTLDETGNTDLTRLSLEYLPLSFGRRHGDPSRPWNRFNIVLKEEDGSPSESYQGNWRDIFQNWEALSLSYPDYLPSMIARFLNSSTIDGYNPYRINSDGVDWEIPDPNDPWAYIGYWGDHQVIYLQKLLELLNEHNDSKIQEWADRRLFSYANVPYRIRSFDEILADPYDTIVFDEKIQETTEKRYSEIGADGKMVLDTGGQVIKASFTEKILLVLLSKMVNFIPGAGIWMNTQRPEWNDANNALVGNGASMVTLYYMHRMIVFLEKLFKDLGTGEYEIRKEHAELFRSVLATLALYQDEGRTIMNGRLRRTISMELGKAGSDYRKKVYEGLSGEFTVLAREEITHFLYLSGSYIEICTGENRRNDGLYNAYNLVEIDDEKISVLPLQEMLEGQVAVLSSGMLNANEAAELLQNMYKSELYREDQDSFVLYPDRELKTFRDNNIISSDDVKRSKLFRELLKEGDNSIIKKDIKGNYHFNGNFTRREDMEEALEKLDDRYDGLIHKEKTLLAEIFENTFNHKWFTGRSGSFYKYEGLGSIYWHMVSKLLLATGEIVQRTVYEEVNERSAKKLKDLYYRIREGIGADKSPDDYGAFPCDPYSHTPSMTGVQQPGMTGQVKEDILSRYMELGIRSGDGRISFDPFLLRKKEFISDREKYSYIKFSYCGVPVKYYWADNTNIKVIYAEGKMANLDKLELSKEQSGHIFSRDGVIAGLEVYFDPENFSL